MTRHARGLLDTSVVIDFDPAAVGFVADAVAISTITLAELAYGLHIHDPIVNAARQGRYRAILETFDVIDFDVGCADAYGAVAAHVRALGSNPRPRRFDLMIAAVAIRHGLPLITRNPTDLAGLSDTLVVEPV